MRVAQVKEYCNHCKKHTMHQHAMCTTAAMIAKTIGGTAYTSLVVGLRVPLLGWMLLPLIVIIDLFVLLPIWMVFAVLSPIGPRVHLVKRCIVCLTVRP